MYRAVLMGLAASTMLTGMGLFASADQTPELIVPADQTSGGHAYAVSPDGTVVVGHRGGHAVVWDAQIHDWASGDPFRTPDAGETLGDPSLGSLVRGISTRTDTAGRHTLVGRYFTAGGEERGFVTTYNSSSHDWFPMIDIGTLNGGNLVSAQAVSETDRMIVGYARDGGLNRFRGFRVLASDVEAGTPNAMEALDTVTGTGDSRAYGISLDGTVIVGSSETEAGTNNTEAVMWTAPDQVTALGKLDNSDRSEALAADFYGNIIVGSARGQTEGTRAFRWTEDTGMVSLGVLDGTDTSRALGISSLGGAIVGSSTAAGVSQGFRWTEAAGMQSIEEWLEASGATLASDHITGEATAANSDGTVVVGQTLAGEMFIARGAASASSDAGTGDDAGAGGDAGTGDPTPVNAGIITVNDLGTSLASVGTTTTNALGGMTVVLNGAGSRPFDRLAQEGGSIAWTTGDLGLLDDDVQDSGFGLAEVGVGRSFSGFQANATVGYSRSRTEGFLGSSTVTDSVYARAELLAPVYAQGEGGLWAVVTGAFALGTADLDRNYTVGGGAISTSRAQTDLHALAVRGRLQWRGAVPYASPFVELGWSEACFDGYLETGGAFPARFADMCTDKLTGRYGVDVTVPVTPTFRVTGTFEGVHRLSGTSSAINGQVVGLQAFSVPGVALSNWSARAGLGFEADVTDRASLSIMANGTLGDDTSSAWLSASYRINF